jgi:hypothetical protein
MARLWTRRHKDADEYRLDGEKVRFRTSKTHVTIGLQVPCSFCRLLNDIMERDLRPDGESGEHSGDNWARKVWEKGHRREVFLGFNKDPPYVLERLYTIKEGESWSSFGYQVYTSAGGALPPFL